MFYDRFEELCKEKGIRVGRAADDMNIRRSTVSAWKQSGYTPRSEILNKIADYFGVTVDYLTGASDKKAPTPEGERPITFDDFTYAMFEEGKELTEMDKQILLSMARQLNDARKQKDGESG